MQSLPRSLFTLVPLFAQGTVLAIEIIHVANKSISGTHRLDVRHVRKTSNRNHESRQKATEGHLQNATYKLVPSELRQTFVVWRTEYFCFSSLLDRASRNSSTGLMIIPLVMFFCIVIMCITVIDELPVGDQDASLAGQRRSVPVSRKNVSRGFAGEPPSFVNAAAPPGAVGHGYNGAMSPDAATPPGAVGYGYSGARSPGATMRYGFQSVGHGYSGPQSGISTPGSSVHNVFPSVAATSSLKLPDPICPELLLTVESWYAVEFDSIDRCAGPIHIYGRFKMLLLTAHMQTDSRGLASITLAMGDGQGSPVGAVTHAGRTLMIEDKSGRLYGEIERHGKLSYTLRCGGVEQLKFNVDDRSGSIAVVSPHDGKRLASASKTSDVVHLPSPRPHLGIDVAAGVDPGLTVLCILGLMAFDHLIDP